MSSTSPVHEPPRRAGAGYDPGVDGPVDPRDRQGPSGRRSHARWWGRGSYLTPWPTRVWAGVLSGSLVVSAGLGRLSWSLVAATLVAVPLVRYGGAALTSWRRLVGPLPTLEEALVTAGGATGGVVAMVAAPAVATLLFPTGLLVAWWCWSVLLMLVPAPETARQWVSMRTWVEAVRRHPKDGVGVRLFAGGPLWVLFDPLYSRAARKAARG